MRQAGPGATEGAARQAGFAAGVGVAALGVQADGAALGVEAVERVGAGGEGEIGNGGLGNQVPADHVAEGFVEPHAVHEHRQALGRAEQGAGGEAAVVEVGLQRVAGHFVDRHAGQAALEVFGQRAAAGLA